MTVFLPNQRSRPGSPLEHTNRPSALTAMLTSLRPQQWSKNLLLLAGLVFGLRLFDLPSVGHAAIGFAAFCGLSSAVYIFNDLADRAHDRAHPLKMHRPIASGALSAAAAVTLACALAAFALAAAAALGWQFFALAVVYLTLFVVYSGYLKHLVIVDVIVIAIGFVLRAAAGAVAVDVEISHWLLVCTFLLALFIALAKRRHELIALADVATRHRPTLEDYETTLLDQMIAITGGSALIAYVFYSISSETEARFATHWLGLTIPFPAYGIFRYLYLAHRHDGGGNPADTLLVDRPLLVCVLLWGITAICIIYHVF